MYINHKYVSYQRTYADAHCHNDDFAYKKNISDFRESPAIDIIRLLKEKGGKVAYHDPHVPTINDVGLAMISESDLNTSLQQADCVVIVTDHSDYDWLDIKSRAMVLVDTRNVG